MKCADCDAKLVNGDHVHCHLCVETHFTPEGYAERAYRAGFNSAIKSVCNRINLLTSMAPDGDYLRDRIRELATDGPNPTDMKLDLERIASEL
jgi:hypothetical protein